MAGGGRIYVSHRVTQHEQFDVEIKVFVCPPIARATGLRTQPPHGRKEGRKEGRLLRTADNPVTSFEYLSHRIGCHGASQVRRRVSKSQGCVC